MNHPPEGWETVVPRCASTKIERIDVPYLAEPWLERHYAKTRPTTVIMDFRNKRRLDLKIEPPAGRQRFPPPAVVDSKSPGISSVASNRSVSESAPPYNTWTCVHCNRTNAPLYQLCGWCSREKNVIRIDPKVPSRSLSIGGSVSPERSSVSSNKLATQLGNLPVKRKPKFKSRRRRKKKQKENERAICRLAVGFITSNISDSVVKEKLLLFGEIFELRRQRFKDVDVIFVTFKTNLSAYKALTAGQIQVGDPTTTLKVRAGLVRRSDYFKPQVCLLCMDHQLLTGPDKIEAHKKTEKHIREVEHTYNIENESIWQCFSCLRRPHDNISATVKSC
eukprot:509291_1